MTRAEKSALKEYPVSPTNDNKEARAIYQRGYEQAEKDIILMVKKWIMNVHRVCDITDENGLYISLQPLYESLDETIKGE